MPWLLAFLGFTGLAATAEVGADIGAGVAIGTGVAETTALAATATEASTAAVTAAETSTAVLATTEGVADIATGAGEGSAILTDLAEGAGANAGRQVATQVLKEELKDGAKKIGQTVKKAEDIAHKVDDAKNNLQSDEDDKKEKAPQLNVDAETLIKEDKAAVEADNKSIQQLDSEKNTTNKEIKTLRKQQSEIQSKVDSESRTLISDQNKLSADNNHHAATKIINQDNRAIEKLTTLKKHDEEALDKIKKAVPSVEKAVESLGNSEKQTNQDIKYLDKERLATEKKYPQSMKDKPAIEHSPQKHDVQEAKSQSKPDKPDAEKPKPSDAVQDVVNKDPTTIPSNPTKENSESYPSYADSASKLQKIDSDTSPQADPGENPFDKMMRKPEVLPKTEDVSSDASAVESLAGDAAKKVPEKPMTAEEYALAHAHYYNTPIENLSNDPLYNVSLPDSEYRPLIPVTSNPLQPSLNKVTSNVYARPGNILPGASHINPIGFIGR